MSAEKDPLTIFMEWLFWLLEQNTNFCAQVAVGNRIKFCDTINSSGDVINAADRDPEKESHQPSDYPEVTVGWREGDTHQFCDSSAGKITPHFRITVKTGDRRFAYLKDGVYTGLCPVMWSIIESLNKWEILKTKACYKGEYFVKSVILFTHIETLNAKPEPGTTSVPRGWTLTWDGEVEMWFGSTALPAA
jgi:hypothetical protein